MTTHSSSLDNFLGYVAEHKKLFYPSIEQNRTKNTEAFMTLGSLMIDWAQKYIGEGFEQVLADGYVHFVTDVNKSQVKYERRGTYLNKSYKEVFENVYNNPEHMKYYHWGVYVTTFAWAHHLKIYTFFRQYFLPLLAEKNSGALLDLGSGSGIWSLLFLEQFPQWHSFGADISETSVEVANRMASVIEYADRAKFGVEDALLYTQENKFDAVLSCFLLEHLETPDKLFANIANNLNSGGYAFVTGALTAAEVDHIYEFRHESDIIRMAEESGFRVIAAYSAAPAEYPTTFKLLPRSMALVIQKRHHDVW